MSWDLAGFKKYTIGIILVNTLILSGCMVVNYGGGHAYDTQRADIKYMCRSVLGIFWSDIIRADCFYATNVQESGSQYSYYPYPDSEAQRLGLQPNFGFWSEYGKWVLLAGFILIKIIGAAADGSTSGATSISSAQNNAPELNNTYASTPDTNFHCPICGLPYKHQENLEAHILANHPNTKQ